jgi:hypothetical protein
MTPRGCCRPSAEERPWSDPQGDEPTTIHKGETMFHVIWVGWHYATVFYWGPGWLLGYRY